MKKNLQQQLWSLALFSLPLIGANVNPKVLAQITPDNTLGNESSVVTPNVNIKGIPSDLIQGGAARGANLFHSFSEFNIDATRGAYFANPAKIRSIFSRVTGSNPSEILGRLGVLGEANLFFINPNGIIFGKNASLDLKGSFVGSTANSFSFPDGSQFSATNPQAPPLLKIEVEVPVGLVFEGKAASSLENAGNLEVGKGKNLTLQGDIITNSGSLTASGGTIHLLGNQVSPVDKATFDSSYPSNGDTFLIGKENLESEVRRGYVVNDGIITGENIVVNARTLVNYNTLDTSGGIGGLC
ncbi:MAG: filamentous hemagglutinin N-terminal domain-containing protein [Moorea sp. SIO2B7]|nr:filamentous hemagglutinin N-terminal domain-containing protein [Moorena sp. SIO2B7]